MIDGDVSRGSFFVEEILRFGQQEFGRQPGTSQSVVAFAKSALVEESRGLGGATKSKLDLIIGNLGNQYETLLNKQAKLPGDPYA